MARLNDGYVRALDALPWPVVLAGVGIMAPKHADGGAFHMLCRPGIERKPSLRFYPNGTFHCHSCGDRGNVFTFVLRYLATGGHRHSVDPGDPFDPVTDTLNPSISCHTTSAYRKAFRHFERRHGISARR